MSEYDKGYSREGRERLREESSIIAGSADALHRITDALASGKGCQVRVTDKTLLPYIQPGDLMFFVSTNFVKMGTGDFVMYRLGSGQPMVRRAISKCFIEGQATVITRSDVDHKDTDQVRAAQLMARLTHIERRGQKIKAWRLNRGLMDWVTQYGTRHPLSRVRDFFLAFLPVHSRKASASAAKKADLKKSEGAARRPGRGRSGGDDF